MTRAAILDAIRAVLAGPMAHAHLGGFGPEARLNEDLRLDSVLMMQVFLNLELDHGLAAPEQAIGEGRLATVADLAALFEAGSALQPEQAADPRQAVASGEGVHGEDYVDIKVHCVVSCLCDALKRAGIDHRPMYFGLWDGEFALNDRMALRYHAATIDHGRLLAWYERLYGIPVRPWYDHDRSKADNIAALIDLVDRRAPSESVMVMLDMFHLPERDNKFNQNPFPHYLLLETAADPTVWRVRDVDYRWEGDIARSAVIEAVRQPTVAGGYRFDAAGAHPAADVDLRAWFEAGFLPDHNPLTDALRRIVAAHGDGTDGLDLSGLRDALAELPILIIRKYAYEHGFAVFWRALRLPAADFDRWCDAIETLVSDLKTFHYAAFKLAETGNRSLLPDLAARLDGLDRQERAIKQGLGTAFDQWCTDRFAAERPRRAAGGRGR